MEIDWEKHHRFQEKEGYCGVAVIQSILAIAGIDKTQDEIAKDVYLKFWGVSQQIMLAYLGKYYKTVNYRHNSRSGDISFHLKKNHAIVLNWWDGESEIEGDGHYSIVSDYDTKNRVLSLVDPSNERDGFWKIKYSEFKNKWFDTITLDNKLWIGGWMLWVDPISKR